MNEAKQIQDKKWIVIGKWIESVLFAYSSITGRSAKYNKKTLGWEYDFKNFLYLDYELKFEEFDFLEMKKFFLGKLKENPFWFEEYIEIVQNASDEMIKWAKKHKLDDYSSCSNDELKILFEGWFESVNTAQPVLEGYQLVGELLEEKIKSMLGNREDLIILTSPLEKIEMMKESEDLLKIAVAIQKNKLSESKQQKLLNNHVKKYSWISTHHFIGNPNRVNGFHERLQFLLKRDCIKELDTKKEKELEYNQLFKKTIGKYKSQDLLRYCQIARTMAHLKPYRIDAYYIAWATLYPLFIEIAKRIGCSSEELMYLSNEEIILGLKENKVEKKLINERLGGFTILKSDDALQIISGKKLKQLQKELGEKSYEGVSEVKGECGYKGTVKGTCRVVTSDSEISKVAKGEILIVSMTDPNYIMAMEKASAFVTDFGGILCHAAIVAREMNKPCVIGTNIATKIFKTGDQVEVFAEKGLVRRIA